MPGPPPGFGSVLTRPVLSTRDLRKRFGAVAAVDGVSLDIPAGAIVAVIGPSGCGKSTLLRLMAGLEAPDTGAVLLDDRDITDLPPARRAFGFVFQSYALFPNLSVRENVAFGLRAMTRRQRNLRVAEMLELVQLTGHAAKRPSQLSGGQQQRVALARSLAPGPRILLLDEPLSALDPQTRLTMRQEIRRLQRQLGVAVVMVTHDQDEAMTLADRVALLRAGRVEQVGDPETLYRRPVNAFVAGFLGSMNLLSGWRLGTNGVLTRGSAHLSVAEPPPVGADARLVAGFRPEAATIARAAIGWNEPNRLPGRVTALEFRGAFVRCEIALTCFGDPDAVVVCCDLPGAAAGGHLAPGMVVDVIVPPEALRAFPEQECGAP